MTIHLHSKHYLESGLPLQEYMICLLYEQKKDWTVRELAAFLSLSDRTVTRSRVFLIAKGYMVKKDTGNKTYPLFELTDKLYPSKKKVFGPAV